MYLTEKQIDNLTPEEFSKYWKDNSIQDSCLKHLGARAKTEDDKIRDAEDK